MDDALLPKVDHLLRVSRTKQARQLLAVHLSANPADPIALFYLGRAAVIDSEYTEARNHLAQALRLDPAAEGPRALLFYVETAEQKFGAAEQIVIELIRENPRDPDYLAMYADLMLRTGHLPKSRELSAQALLIAPDHMQALRAQVLLDIVSGKHQDAEHTLAGLIEQEPDNEEISFTLFQLLVERQRLEEATRLGQELLRLHPGNTALITALIEIRVLTHPLGLPLYPLRKAGWLGSGVMWIVSIVGYKVLARINQPLASAFILTYLAFVIYSWVYPSLMRRWLRARGL
jgi:predicted Zn-dependent protease